MCYLSMSPGGALSSDQVHVEDLMLPPNMFDACFSTQICTVVNWSASVVRHTKTACNTSTPENLKLGHILGNLKQPARLIQVVVMYHHLMKKLYLKTKLLVFLPFHPDNHRCVVHSFDGPWHYAPDFWATRIHLTSFL